jgi:phosphoglycerate dehydrogenase-like enzyme
VESLLFSGPDHAVAVVRKLLGGSFDVIAVPAEPAQLLPALERCTVYLDASMKVPISADSIDKAKYLKLIVTATTGASHIDQAALARRGIPLLTLKGQREVLRELTPAAELSWLLMMACARHLRAAIHHVEEGGWERTRFPGLMLRGRTLGIVGLGRLGSWMARYGDAFGMRVIGHDPYVDEVPQYVQRMELEALLAQSDCVSIHIHLSAETERLLNRQRLSCIKPGAILVNTSRAELVDQDALVDLLEQGQLAAAGLDVLYSEPNVKQDRLWRYAQDHDNVIITPHIGGFAPDAVDKVVAFSCERILRHFSAP